MVKKAIEQWELSLNLGSDSPTKAYPGEINIARYIGTRYHLNDPYREIMKRKAAIPRIYPGTDNGKPEGKPVFFSNALMKQKREDMGPYVFGCQILQDPVADQVQGFKIEWIHHYKRETWSGMNLYLLSDAAREKKRDNDYSVQLIIGLNADNNYYLIDGVRARMNLTERAKSYINLHRKYLPLKSAYEKNSAEQDIEFIEYLQENENYRFDITPIHHHIPKFDRIRKLIPIFEQGRFYIPTHSYFIDHEKKQHDLSQELRDDELILFPVGPHDDILDTIAQILDDELDAQFPKSWSELHHIKQADQAVMEYDMFDEKRNLGIGDKAITDYDMFKDNL
jgi:predicted phage terminase large subunit-like protein